MTQTVMSERDKLGLARARLSLMGRAHEAEPPERAAARQHLEAQIHDLEQVVTACRAPLSTVDFPDEPPTAVDFKSRAAGDDR